MRIPQKAQAQERYNKLKSLMQKAAAKPSNQALFDVDGDRVELKRDARVPLDGKKIVLKAGSAIDNDVKTRDTISTETTVDGVVQKDTFEHFSERKGLPFFKYDQEMMTVTYADRHGAGFGHQTSTFEI